ncbi:MAG: hybrid sensor histidine kinase/response regulator [Thainema sp.]
MLNKIPQLQRYGIAIASVAIALILMLALDPFLYLYQASFLLFFGAITITALYGGRSAGIVATLLAALFANYFFLAPQYAWTLDLASSLRMAIFIVQGVLISVLVGSLRAAQIQIRKNLTQIKASESAIKDLNKTLQRRVEELQTLFDVIPINIVVAEDPDCRVVRANPAYSKRLQIPPDTNVSVAFPDNQVQLYRFYQNGQEVIGDDLPVEHAAKHGVEVRDIEIDLVQQDNTVINLYGHAVPLFDETGQPRGSIGVFTDITELKRVETALRDSEEQLKSANQRFHLAAQAVNCLIYEWDLTCDRVERTDGLTRILGYSLEEAEPTGQWWADRVHPDDLPIVREYAWSVLATDDHCSTEYRVLNKANQYIDMLDQCLVVARDAEGKPTRIVGSTTDISDRKRAAAEYKQAEDSLRKSEERLRLAVEAAQLGTWDIDLKTAQAIWSEQHFTILGYEPVATGEANEAMWDSRLHPEDREHVIQAWQQSQQEHQLYQAEYRVTRADNGQIAWLAALGSFTYDANGEAVRSLGVVFDISDRKQAEMALVAQEQRYRYIFEAVGISIWEEDFSEVKAAIDRLKSAGVQDFRQYFIDHPEFVQWAINTVSLRDVNQASLQLFDVQTKAELLNSLNQIFTPETYETFVEELLTIAAEETYFATETTLQNLQGKHFQVWLSISFPDPSQPYDRVLISLLDITDRKQAEASILQLNQQLQEKVTELQTLLDVIPIGIGIAEDPDCQYICANPAFARLLNLPPNVNTSLSAPKAERPTTFKIYQNGREMAPDELPLQYAAKHGVAVNDLEVNIVRQDGTVATLLEYAAPLFDKSGQPRGSVGAFLDISDRKQAEAERQQLLERERTVREEAERANRVKDEFLSILSHELRSPLNPILGWARLLQAKQFNEATTSQALATIERNARLQTQLIDDLLDVAKILRGKLSLNEAPVNLVSAIEAALEVVRTAAEAKAIQLVPDLTDIGLVLGDSARLQQVVWNLLSNAVKFTPNGGRVEVRLERVSDQAQISVTDTGKGINPQFLPHIFESFRQEDVSITRRYGGLGLGLSIVKYLIDAHGGTITADSAGEDQGATFTIQLPLLHEDTVPSTTARFSPAQIDLTGINVLAVDDSEDARDLLAMLLTQYGAEARVVATGKELLALLNRIEPHVLVCDIGMPEMDGYLLLQQIRALPADQGGNIPAIALTAYAKEEDYQRAIDHGFQRHIAKPVDPELLAIAIAELAKNR